MNTTNLAAVTVVTLVFYVGVRYCLKFLRREITPRIATWLIFEIGVVMSLASYLAGHDHSLTKAALNVADCFQVTVILLVLLFGQGRRRIEFTPKERLSLWVSGIAALAWMLTKTGWVGFAGFQTVMSIAYLPTLESLWLWRNGKPPEPLDKWSLNVLITLIGLAVDLTGKRDYLAMVSAPSAGALPRGGRSYPSVGAEKQSGPPNTLKARLTRTLAQTVMCDDDAPELDYFR